MNSPEYQRFSYNQNISITISTMNKKYLEEIKWLPSFYGKMHFRTWPDSESTFSLYKNGTVAVENSVAVI